MPTFPKLSITILEVSPSLLKVSPPAFPRLKIIEPEGLSDSFPNIIPDSLAAG